MSLISRSLLFHNKCIPIFQDWITNWTFHLIDCLPGGEDSAVKRLMVACRPAATVDIQCAQFLLPHILVHVIKSPATHPQVMAEIEAVFRDPADSGGRSEGEGVVSSPRFDTKKKMAAQTVFSVLDHLNRYGRRSAWVIILLLTK